MSGKSAAIGRWEDTKLFKGQKDGLTTPNGGRVFPYPPLLYSPDFKRFQSHGTVPAMKQRVLKPDDLVSIIKN